jgi:hypothetical protein
MAQYWLTELAHVNLLFRWDLEVGAPGLKLVGERSRLFGALGLQLIFAMSGTRDCGRTAAIRDAQARFRAQHPDYYKARKRAVAPDGDAA